MGRRKKVMSCILFHHISKLLPALVHSVSLRLTDVDIPEEVLHYLLCYCPLLEVLRLKGAERLIRIRISGPSLKLKYLELRDLPNLSSREIDVANLVSFEFCARELIVDFKHVPSLAEMSIESDYCVHFMHGLHRFPSILSQLRTPKLNLMAVTVSRFYFVLFAFKYPSGLANMGAFMYLIYQIVSAA